MILCTTYGLFPSFVVIPSDAGQVQCLSKKGVVTNNAIPEMNIATFCTLSKKNLIFLLHWWTIPMV
jgi:hypothetical protein